MKRPFKFIVSALRATAADTNAENGVLEPLHPLERVREALQLCAREPCLRQNPREAMFAVAALEDLEARIRLERGDAE